FVPEHNTPMILEIRNIMDDLEMAFGNADVMEKMDKAFLEDAMDEMKSSALVAVDGNLNEEALAYLFDELQDVPVFFDPENPQKAARAKEY
ncbi:MAG: hypothetical protein RR661_08000, partial [Anaerovoracaceae bacterium]